MCGIAGLKGEFTSEQLSLLESSLKHRGPDASGRYVTSDNDMALIHTRLSIQDISSAGNQPMVSSCKNFVLSYNGEIYNFKKLKAELVKKSYRFYGKSDSEVVLNLFIEYGISFLKMLEGDFAISIWDNKLSKLLIARDRMGVKPLYYYNSNSTFAFSSEISNLLDIIIDKKDINLKSVKSFLSYLWIPGNNHLISGVKKLPPGSAMWIGKNNCIEQISWTKLPHINQNYKTLNKNQAISNVRENIKKAVHEQLVSDVPVGAFLSGGLDSSSIVYFAKEKIIDFQCFTINTNNTIENGVEDDLPYAIKVAKHLNVNLNIVDFDLKNIERDLNLITKLNGEPISDLSILNSYYICRDAREKGIKVLLSGTGGDDIFSGYRRHSIAKVDSLIDYIPRPIKNAIKYSNKILDNRNILFRYMNKIASGVNYTDNERIVNYYRWLDNDIIIHLFKKEFREEINQSFDNDPIVKFIKQRNETSTLSKMLAIEQKFFLADHNLIYTDRTSMANGVEVRVPFLHESLVDLAATLPDNFKLNRFKTKWIFRKAMEGHLPHDIIYRKKTGFGAPVRIWIKNEFRELIRDLLSHESVQKRGIFDSKKIQKILQDNESGKIEASYTIMALLGLEIWFRNFINT
jgi:asparagine synthase (glutamine-hydrolysing)